MKTVYMTSQQYNMNK